MNLYESSVIFSQHKIRGVFLFLTLLCIMFPCAASLAPRLYPPGSEKNISVIVEYNGADEKDMEKMISRIEQPLSGINGLKSVFSVSEAGKGTVYCSFSDKKNYNEAYLEVRDCVNRIYALFPENVQRPVLLKSGINNSPVFAASFTPGIFLNKKNLEREFEEIRGCCKAEAGGENGSEIIIIPDTEKMLLSSFDISSIISTIKKENSTAVISRPGNKQIKTGKRLMSAEEAGSILLAPGQRLSDFAEVLLREKETETEGRINGRKKTVLYAMKEGESSVITVCRRLKKKTEKLGGNVIFNRGEEIEKALRETALAVSAGIAAVIITAVFYFRDTASSVLVILNIIFSVTASAAALKFTCHSLDIITLSAAAVVSGLAIDNSIIFLEKYNLNKLSEIKTSANDKKVFQSDKKITALSDSKTFSASPKSSRLPEKTAVSQTIKETIQPLLFSFLSTIAVFPPLLFGSADIKTMFSGMAVSVTSGLSASFLFTFYFTPLCLYKKNPEKLNSRKERKNKSGAMYSGFNKIIKKISLKILKNLIEVKYISFFILSFLILSSVYISSLSVFKPFSFRNSSILTFYMEFPAGSSFKYVRQKSLSVEKDLLSFPEPEKNAEAKNSTYSAVLKIEKERSRFDIKTGGKKHLKAVKLKLIELAEQHKEIFFHYPLSDPAVKYYDIDIYGNNFTSAAADAYRLGKIIEEADSSWKTIYHFKTPAEGLKIIIKNKDAYNNSISPDEAGRYLYTLVTSPVITKYYPDNQERDIKFGSDNIYTPYDLETIQLTPSLENCTGKIKILREISEIVPYFSPERIYHRNRQRSLSMAVAGINNKAGIKKLEKIISAFKFSSSCRGEGGKQFSEDRKNAEELLLLMLLSFLFIYTVLTVQFESFRIPALITAGIPASFFFPLIILKVSEIDISVSTALALILTAGISVNNSIIILSPFKLKKTITPEALAASLSEKSGAVLTASFTTLLSVIPLIFSSKSSLLAPFSITLSAGIAGSLALLPLILALSVTDS